MAFGAKEDPGRSLGSQLEGVEFPVWRETLVRIAADNGATVDVINTFNALPRGRYESRDEVERDFAEAGRRFANGGYSNDDAGVVRDRRNLGKDAVENAPEGQVRHP